MRFKVTGNHKVGGVEPGETVELDDSDPRTQALVRARHVTPVPKKAKTTTTKGDA